MIRKTHAPLAPYTTFKIGGPAEELFIPENEPELIELLGRFSRERIPFYILGHGSNLLIPGGTIRRKVILLKKACTALEILPDGRVFAGASVDLREMVNIMTAHSLALHPGYSTIPATIGGALYMNAGRPMLKLHISQNLIRIRFWDGHKIRTEEKAFFSFRHRWSSFHDHPEWVIVGAEFKFETRPQDELLREKKECWNAVRDRTYFKYPSAGSVFAASDAGIMRRLQGLRIGGAEYSRTTPNTIHNLGKATFRQVMLLIRTAQLLHAIAGRKCKVELNVWKNK